MEAAVEDAVDRALAKAREAGNRATASRRKSAAQESLDRAMAAAQSDMNRAVADVERAAEDLAKEFAADERKAAAPKKAAKKKKKKKKEPEKLPGKLLRVIGLCLLALGAVVGVDAAAEILQGWTYYLEDLFMGLGFAAAGGIMWGRGQYLARMARRTNRYTNAIGEAEAMPLDEIAKRVNRSPAKAARELQKLIDKGYLGEDAYIDRERGYFLRFGATVEEEEPEEAAPPPPKEAEEGYSGILRDFRRVNDRIADEDLSRKIDRLEQVSAMIFKEVEEHPEKRERIRTFFDYYLPTTQKLLEAYAEFEETAWTGSTCGRPRSASSRPWTASWRASSTSWTSSTPPTPWTWSATSRSWRPCSTGTPPLWPRTSATTRRRKNRKSLCRASPPRRRRTTAASSSFSCKKSAGTGHTETEKEDSNGKYGTKISGICPPAG